MVGSLPLSISHQTYRVCKVMSDFDPKEKAVRLGTPRFDIKGSSSARAVDQNIRFDSTIRD